MKSNIVPLSLAALVAIASPSIEANAQVIEIATAGAGVASSALLGKSVAQIISSARLAASGLLAEAKNTGNALIARGADELNASADNATRLLDAEINKQFDRLDAQQKDIMLNLAKATAAVTSLANKAYLAKDTIALDTRSIIGSAIPFQKEVFVLQRVSGLTHLQKNSDYDLQLIGSYVGTPASGYRTDISITIGGKKVSDLRRNPKEVHVTGLTIPNAQLQEHIKKDQVAIVEAEINIDYYYPGTFLLLFSREQHKSISSKVHLALYPNYAGAATLTTSTVQYGWKALPPLIHEQTGPNAHCSSHCNGNPGIPTGFDLVESGGDREPHVVGDVRFVGASCTPVPGHNGFDDAISGSVQDGGRRAHCQWTAHSHPSTYRLTAQREQWTAVSDKREDTSVDLYYNQLTEVRVPKNPAALRIRGKTLAGDTFDQLLGEPDPAAPVQLIQRAENAADTSIFLRPSPPTGLD